MEKQIDNGRANRGPPPGILGTPVSNPEHHCDHFRNRAFARPVRVFKNASLSASPKPARDPTNGFGQGLTLGSGTLQNNETKAKTRPISSRIVQEAFDRLSTFNGNSKTMSIPHVSRVKCFWPRLRNHHRYHILTPGFSNHICCYLVVDPKPLALGWPATVFWSGFNSITDTVPERLPPSSVASLLVNCGRAASWMHREPTSLTSSGLSTTHRPSRGDVSSNRHHAQCPLD